MNGPKFSHYSSLVCTSAYPYPAICCHGKLVPHCSSPLSNAHVSSTWSSDTPILCINHQVLDLTVNSNPSLSPSFASCKPAQLCPDPWLAASWCFWNWGLVYRRDSWHILWTFMSLSILYVTFCCGGWELFDERELFSSRSFCHLRAMMKNMSLRFHIWTYQSQFPQNIGSLLFGAHQGPVHTAVSVAQWRSLGPSPDFWLSSSRRQVFSLFGPFLYQNISSFG